MKNNAFKMHAYAKYIMVVATACLVVSILMRGNGIVSTVFLWLGLGLGIVSIFINATYWKCPYCGGHFEMKAKEKDLTLCPFCEKPLK